MYETGLPPDKAVLADAKYAYSPSDENRETPVDVVVMEIEFDATAVPFGTSVMLTTEGVAETVRVSPSVSCGRGFREAIRITCAGEDCSAIASVIRNTATCARIR